MAIEKYTTEAFILKEYIEGESDLTYKVWTKDFGIIFVLARSIRKVNAKLRMLTKKHNFLSLTLVKGKNIWRLVGVEDLNCNQNNEKYFAEVKSIIAEVIHRFLEEKKSYKKLFEKLKSILTLNQKELEILKIRTLIYYLVLVDTGYADAKIIGVKDLEEYKSFNMKDFYLHFILNEDKVKEHLAKILKESML